MIECQRCGVDFELTQETTECPSCKLGCRVDWDGEMWSEHESMIAIWDETQKESQMNIKCIAFDCFGTVFDMSGISRDEIKAYVEHVRKNDFTPFRFPWSWWEIQAHPDSAEGIWRLQQGGYQCVALSNGDAELIWNVSRNGNIEWNYVVDLRAEKVYKPNIDAYRTIEKLLGWKPEETLMVTANPTFGDIEGAAAVGMHSQVIRQLGTPRTIIELAENLGC